ncbi:MAG: hypothetical protein ACRDOK_27965 [Streptosporangiaceae bacterium]
MPDHLPMVLDVAALAPLAAQAEHRRAIAEFHARHLADQQARIDALLTEAVAALADLLGAPGSAAPCTCQCSRAEPHQP